MGLLTFSINVTLDGCVDHQEGIADDETHAFFTRLMDEGGAMLWGRVTYGMMESHWPAVARGDTGAPPAMREWAVKLEAKPKYVVSSTRKAFPLTNSHNIAEDLLTGVQRHPVVAPARPDVVLRIAFIRRAQMQKETISLPAADKRYLLDFYSLQIISHNFGLRSAKEQTLVNLREPP
jgi:hypothetical protein